MACSLRLGSNCVFRSFFSVSTALTETVPDAESAAEGGYEQTARLNVPVVLQAKKRDRAEMSEVLTVSCSQTMTDLDTGATNVDPDPDAKKKKKATQSACKKRKEETSPNK